MASSRALLFPVQSPLGVNSASSSGWAAAPEPLGPRGVEGTQIAIITKDEEANCSETLRSAPTIFLMKYEHITARERNPELILCWFLAALCGFQVQITLSSGRGPPETWKFPRLGRACENRPQLKPRVCGCMTLIRWRERKRDRLSSPKQPFTCSRSAPAAANLGLDMKEGKKGLGV